jgi:hypothetical protein
MSSPTITRQNVIRGPGTVTLGTCQFFDAGGISADVDIDTFGVPVSAYGNVDTRRKDVKAKISFKPCGEITAPILAALYPHGTPSIGASLLGSTDVPCHVHSLAGQKVTFHAAALTRMPNLKLSTIETAFSGQAEILALLKNGVARTADNSLYTVAPEAWAGAFDVANLLGGSYLGTWSGITFQTAAGWDIEFEMGVEEQYADGVGTYDAMLTDVTVRAKCRPLGISESTLLGYLNVQGATAVLGGSMRSGQDLTVTATGGLTVILHEVAVVRGPMKWGNTDLRVDEIGFVSHREIDGGTPGALFSVAIA